MCFTSAALPLVKLRRRDSNPNLLTIRRAYRTGCRVLALLVALHPRLCRSMESRFQAP
jgi:hypothetical protein